VHRQRVFKYSDTCSEEICSCATFLDVASAGMYELHLYICVVSFFRCETFLTFTQPRCVRSPPSRDDDGDWVCPAHAIEPVRTPDQLQHEVSIDSHGDGSFNLHDSTAAQRSVIPLLI
jgi:hypothetical protein